MILIRCRAETDIDKNNKKHSEYSYFNSVMHMKAEKATAHFAEKLQGTEWNLKMSVI